MQIIFLKGVLILLQKNYTLVLCILALLVACASATTVAPIATPTAVPVILLAPTVIPATPSNEAYHLKIASYPYLTEGPYFLAQENGYFAEQGLDVEFIPFTQSSAVIPALVAEQLDVTTVFPNPSFFSAVARDAKIEIVAGKGYLDPNACAYTGLMASSRLLASGKLSDSNNWKGLKIATELGSMSEYGLDILLEQNSLTPKDVTIVNLPISNRSDALRTGAIDIAGAGEPWILRITNNGSGTIWQSFNNILPGATWGLVAFGPSLIEQHPDVGKRFMVAFLKGIAKYNEGKTDSNVAILAKYTQLSQEEIKGMCWNTMKADGTINSQSLLDYQQWAFDNGYLTQKLTLNQFWDPKYINFANQYVP
jgi:NitT/TauT family transport system substrate-binding protein